MAITTAPIEDTDSLASLEERIVRTVQLVSQLRLEKDAALTQMAEKDAVLKKLEANLAEHDAATSAQLTGLRQQNERLTEELETLRSERKQVRTRIEKLLGQMDLLSA